MARQTRASSKKRKESVLEDEDDRDSSNNSVPNGLIAEANNSTPASSHQQEPPQWLVRLLEKQNDILVNIEKRLASLDERLASIQRQKCDGARNPHPRKKPRGHSGRSFQVGPNLGNWKFVETPEIVRERERIKEMMKRGYSYEKRNNGEKILGLVREGGVELCGVKLPPVGLSYNQLPIIPFWDNNDNVMLPRLCFENKEKLARDDGIYCLEIRYNGVPNPLAQAKIIIGNVEFGNDGHATAEGADWDRLLDNQRQSQLPYAHHARGIPTWRKVKLSEKWEDGDVIKFQIDTNENTIVFQRESSHKMILWNILTFTNHRVNPSLAYVTDIVLLLKNH